MGSCKLTITGRRRPRRHASDKHFTDFGKLTYHAESADPTKVSVEGGDKITVTGVASTAKDDGTNTFDAEGVTITVTAMDSGRMVSAKRTFKVVVDAQPARSDVVIPSVTLDEDTPAAGRDINVAFFVKDATGTTVYSLQDNAETHASVTADITEAGVLTLMPTEDGINGSREVKIRAAEPQGTDHEMDSGGDGSVGQYLDFSIMVENAAN